MIESPAEGRPAARAAVALPRVGRAGDRARVPLRVTIALRAAYACAMDAAAAELLFAVEALLDDATMPADAQDHVRRALAEKCATWRGSVQAYRDAGGLRTDIGGLRPEDVA